MTITMTPEALDLVRRARHLLAAAGPDGHTGEIWWSNDGSCRCIWGRIVQAHDPDHDLVTIDALSLRATAVGREITKAFRKVNGDWISDVAREGFDASLEALDRLLLAATKPRCRHHWHAETGLCKICGADQTDLAFAELLADAGRSNA